MQISVVNNPIIIKINTAEDWKASELTYTKTKKNYITNEVNNIMQVCSETVHLSDRYLSYMSIQAGFTFIAHHFVWIISE